MSDAVLKVENLKVHFPVKDGLFTKKQVVKAVDGVSFETYPRETFGPVGGSDCEKNTIGRIIVKLYEPTSGTVYYHKKDVTKIKGSHLAEFHRNVQMIFRDPYVSLNPRMTVGETIREPTDIRCIFNAKEEWEQWARELLNIVGLKLGHIRHYPYEFSGGQRQRIGIVRTLALNPQFVVRSEPINVLNVSIQAQVINPLEHVQKEMGISHLLIAHDLNMVRHTPNQIGVMYLGDLAEVGDSGDMYHRPFHPYIQALLSAVPIPDPRVTRKEKRIVLEGELSNPLDTSSGCVFRTRCPNATERCAEEEPGMVNVGKRMVARFLYEKQCDHIKGKRSIVHPAVFSFL